MRLRLLSLPVLLLVAVLVGGADGCSSDPNVEGAKLYIRQNEYDRALENLDKALEADPQNVDALVLRADVLRLQAEGAQGITEKRRLLDESNQALDQAYAIDPANTDIRNVRTQLWAFSVNEGNRALRNPESDPGDALGYFEVATSVLPDSMQGHFGLGLAHLRAGDARSAIAPLTRATEIAPDEVNAYDYLGRAYLLTDQGTEALRVLQAAADRFPENEDIQTSLLNAYAVSGQTDTAIERYEAQRAARANDPAFLYNYGALLLQADRYDEAIEQFEASIALNPDNADAQYNLGAALQNRATALNEQASETTDNAEAERLLEERDQFLERSLGPLVRARELSDPAGEQAVCNALFQVYTQLNRIDDANGVAECAGFSTN